MAKFCNTWKFNAIAVSSKENTQVINPESYFTKTGGHLYFRYSPEGNFGQKVSCRNFAEYTDKKKLFLEAGLSVRPSVMKISQKRMSWNLLESVDLCYLKAKFKNF